MHVVGVRFAQPHQKLRYADTHKPLSKIIGEHISTISTISINMEQTKLFLFNRQTGNRFSHVTLLAKEDGIEC